MEVAANDPSALSTALEVVASPSGIVTETICHVAGVPTYFGPFEAMNGCMGGDYRVGPCVREGALSYYEPPRRMSDRHSRHLACRCAAACRPREQEPRSVKLSADFLAQTLDAHMKEGIIREL